MNYSDLSYSIQFNSGLSIDNIGTKKNFCFLKYGFIKVNWKW